MVRKRHKWKPQKTKNKCKKCKREREKETQRDRHSDTTNRQIDRHIVQGEWERKRGRKNERKKIERKNHRTKIM